MARCPKCGKPLPEGVEICAEHVPLRDIEELTPDDILMIRDSQGKVKLLL